VLGLIFPYFTLQTQAPVCILASGTPSFSNLVGTLTEAYCNYTLIIDCKPFKISGPISLAIPDTEKFPAHNSQFCDGYPPDLKTLPPWIMATTGTSYIKQNCHKITPLSKSSLHIFVNSQCLLLFYGSKTES
jgi:hypothetical protein